MVSLQLENQKSKSWEIFNRIAHRYDFLNRLLSGGIDVYWRKKLSAFFPKETPLALLDIATGTGDVIFTLVKTPRLVFASILGVDMSKEMLEIAKKKHQAHYKTHDMTFRVEDAQALTVPDQSQDITTIAFGIRNIPDTRAALREMYRVLKPGGKSIVLEFSIPENPVVKAVYLFYFRYILPTLGKWISGDAKAYQYLNKTVEEYPYGKSFAILMEQTGYQQVIYYPLTFGIATLYVAQK